jgi:hypothetical protein
MRPGWGATNFLPQPNAGLLLTEAQSVTIRHIRNIPRVFERGAILSGIVLLT